MELTPPSPTRVPTTRTVVMFALIGDDGGMDAAIRAGMPGYLLRSDDQDALMAAIGELSRGGTPLPGDIVRKVTLHLADDTEGPKTVEPGLSPRETQVLHALVDGLSYKMIADKLGISFETVRSHLKNIYEKLRVHNNTEAVAKALKCRLVA